MSEYERLKNRLKELENSYSIGACEPEDIIEEYNKIYKTIKALNRKQYYENSKKRTSIDIQDSSSEC